MPARAIAADEILAYRRDGLAYLPRLVDGECVAALLEACDRRQAAPGAYSSIMSKTGRFFEERMCSQESPELRRFVLEGGLAAVAGEAMGSSKVRFFFDHLFVCEPNTPLEYYWHQDLPYWPIHGDQVCSLWITLTDCDVESSALELIPGSHLSQTLGVREFGDAEDYGELSAGVITRIPRYQEQPDKYRIARRPMEAGDAYLFSAKTVHGSGGNRSMGTRRVAYSTRWIGDDVVWQPKAFRDDALCRVEAELTPGQSLEHEFFPLIWQRQSRGNGFRTS